MQQSAVTHYPAEFKVAGNAITFDMAWWPEPHGLGLGIFDPSYLYEREVANAIGHFVKPGMFVIDAGANIGFHSMLMSRLVGPAGGVLAIEPDEESHGRLTRTIALNEATNITVRSEALWECDSEAVFFPHRFSGYASLAAYEDSEHGRRIMARALDTLVLAPQPSFIKLDCEGADGFILRGAEQILRRGVDAICCELHFPTMHCMHITEREIREYMHALGYEMFVFPSEADAKPKHIPISAKIAHCGGAVLNVLFSTIEKVEQRWSREC